jgi:hypothetical protein
MPSINVKGYGSGPVVPIGKYLWITMDPSLRRVIPVYVRSLFRRVDQSVSCWLKHQTIAEDTSQTQSELARCLAELTKAKVSHLTEDALRAQDEAYLSSLPQPKPRAVTPPPAPVKFEIPRLTKEQELLRDKWSRLLEMISKGRLESLKSFWEREGERLGGVNAPIPQWTGEKRANLLHIAAHAGHADVTRWLLEDLHADPTIKSSKYDDGENQLAAYDVAGNKDVRDTFRRCAGEHPEWWDWLGEGHVPSTLSKAQEEDRDEKKKVRKKGLKERLKEREVAKEKEEETPLESVTHQAEKDIFGPQKLGGAPKASENLSGLSAEMRMKIERERRARAAEARFKVLGSQ